MFMFALTCDIAPYIMIAERKFIKIFTFDMILRNKMKSKDFSMYENVSNGGKRSDDCLHDSERVDPQKILQGEFGEEIMSIRN